jgi:hypothetical protein
MNFNNLNGNFDQAITDYYKQLSSSTITQDEYKLWIDSLQEPMRGHFKDKGLDNCRGVLNLQRFIIELRDNPLEDYLRERLTEEEYKAYKEAELP